MSLSLGAAFSIGKWWARNRPIKTINAMRSATKAAKEIPVPQILKLKGKLTYSAVIAVIAPVLTAALGFDIVPADLLPLYQGVLGAVALYGRWRATRK